MRVLVVSNLYPPAFQGGYELGCEHMATALADAGHEVRVVSSGADDGAPLVARVLTMQPVFDDALMAALAPGERRCAEVRARGLDAGNARALAAQVEEFRPDVAYLWNLVGVGGLGILAQLERASVPWVWHLMDAVPRLLCGRPGRTVDELAHAFGSHVRGRYLACSAHVLGEIRAGGIDLGERVELLPNWVAGELPPPRREHYAAGTRALRVVTAVGVLGEHKGIDILIEAAARLVEAGEGGFTLDVFGRAPDGRFAAMIERRGLVDVVTLRGLLPQRELAARLRDHDVFAFPTRWREPFAFAPLEAAAAGCVPLISDGSGNAEWMVGNVHCLKAPRTPEAFAGALAAILRGDVELGPIARRGRAIVRDQFHLPALVPRVERALRAAQEEAQASAPARSRASAERIDALASALEAALT